MSENKMTLPLRRIRSIWESLTRCGQMMTTYDKEGKKLTDIKLKFSYAISRNINAVRPILEDVKEIDKKINDYNNELVSASKEKGEQFLKIKEKYQSSLNEYEKLNEETREFAFYKIPAANIPENILGIDLANLDYLIDGEL